MSEVQPPAFIQSRNDHDADTVRQAFASLIDHPGVGGAADLGVVPHGGNMVVEVIAGGCFVPGNSTPSQGYYHCYNDGNVQLGPLPPAASGKHRYDIVYASVSDAFYAGSLNEWKLKVVTGAEVANASTPSDPTPPDVNYLRLARVHVTQGMSVLTANDITDIRSHAAASGAVMVGPTSAVTMEASRYVTPGRLFYITDTGRTKSRLVFWDGTTLQPLDHDAKKWFKVRWSGSFNGVGALTTWPWTTMVDDPWGICPAMSVAAPVAAIPLPDTGWYRITSVFVAQGNAAAWPGVSLMSICLRNGAQYGIGAQCPLTPIPTETTRPVMSELLQFNAGDTVGMAFRAAGGLGTPITAAYLTVEFVSTY